MERNRTIAIAGAGIGGLTAALSLARAGFGVKLLECAPVLSELGAGIQISPNAGHVFRALGLDDELAAASAQPTSIEVRSGRTGRRIASLPLGESVRRYGICYQTIHRADLQHILLTAVAADAHIDLLLGHALIEFATHAHGITIAAETGMGSSEITAAALIGADGVGSTVRMMMPEPSPRLRAGRTAWRTILPADRAPPHLPLDRVGLWLGPSGHVVHYPIRGGREINIVAIVPEKSALDGWNEAASLGELMVRFRRWAQPAQEILAASPRWHRWSISTVAPGQQWAVGPVALMGDAAHAMAPFLAQGGAMAIEDAAVLAATLAASPDDAPAALAAYERIRKPRVRRVWRAAGNMARLYHLGPVTSRVRDAGMRIAGGGALLGRYRWIHGWRQT